MKFNKQGTFSERQLSRRYLILLGSVTASVYFIFILLTYFWIPPNTGAMMRHGGIFFAHKGAVGLILCALFLLYVLLYMMRRRLLNSQKLITIAVLFSFIFVCVLFLTPPFFSSDLYGYITRAAISNIHDANPYYTTPAMYGYEGVVAWSDSVSLYGPLYIGFSMLLNLIIGTSIIANLIIFRLVAALAFFGCAYVIYKILKNVAPRYSAVGAVLFLWNPFFLIEAINSAHNDIFVVFFVLLSVYLNIKNRFVFSIVALTLAALIKFSPIVLLPIVVLLILRQPAKRAIRQGLIALIMVVIIVSVLYLPFGSFSANLSNLGRAFITENNLTLPQAFIQAGLSVLDRYSDFIELNLMSVRAGYLMLFMLPYGYFLFRRGKRGEDTTAVAYFWILLALVFTLGRKFNIWYILWCMPLVLVILDKRYHVIILFMTAYGFLYYVMLSVFIPNLIFCVALAIYGIMLQFSTKDRHQAKKEIT